MSNSTNKRTIKIRPRVIKRVMLTGSVRKLSPRPVIGYIRITRFIRLRVKIR